MAKYKVEYKAFNSSEWYTKTETDSKLSAFSVAKIGNYGRACRLTDTETNEVLFESQEDPDFKAVKGNVSKFKW